jgi:hypothetical protein
MLETCSSLLAIVHRFLSCGDLSCLSYPRVSFLFVSGKGSVLLSRLNGAALSYALDAFAWSVFGSVCSFASFDFD